ncbi:MAG: protein GumC [Desulfobacter sp.]|nr:MAG: protein GumC [Desulfobacter sp.]
MADPFHSQAQIKPDQIIDIVIRGRWILIIPLCISLTLGLAFTLTADKTYQASTLILVQPQRVPTNYVQSVVSSSINERISTISQQILSRSNLEQIIDQFGLFEDAKSMYLEDKIEGMRRKIKVRIERARHGAEAFSISFTGSSPQRVMRVTNTLASYFMDENLKVREAQAIGTSEFLDSELEKTRKRLEDREQKLAGYRAKYLGGLPDELETNLRTLDRLQTQLTDKSTQLRETKNALSLIETQISELKRDVEKKSKVTAEAGDEQTIDSASDNEQKLAIAQNQYENLLLKYTKKHPDVQKLKKTIEKLEKTIQEEKDTAQAPNKDTESGQGNDENTGDNIPKNPTLTRMNIQRKLIINEIKNIQIETAQIKEKMKVYQQRVEDTPKRELELQALKRDYTNIQEIFNSLLDRKLEAELSVNMEKKQKGEQFRILDHARLPEKPISPNVKLLFILSVASGLGLGGGIIFLSEVINLSVIRREEQIEDTLGLNILASIPHLKRRANKLRQRIFGLVFMGCCFYAVMFLGFFALLNFKGLDRTINIIKTYINI